MCGHNGPPDQPDNRKNFARLVLSDGTEAARSYPPRSDVAEEYRWDLSRFAGMSGAIEVVDGDTGGAYAWIAIARISPDGPQLPDCPILDCETSRIEAMRLAGGAEDRGAGRPDLANRQVQGGCSLAVGCLRSLAGIAAGRGDRAAGQFVGRFHPGDAGQAAGGRAVGKNRSPGGRAVLLANLKTAPQPVAVTIASALAGRHDGAVALLAEIRAGRATAALLREPTVENQLRRATIPDLDQQIAELTAKLSPADDRIAKLIAERHTGFLAAKPDVEAGRAVFGRSVCKSCHKIGDVGAAIGPALDGIGLRGLDRLLEDILDPNRNVDQAFRVVSLETESGQIVSGFNLREEGQTVVLYDGTGKQIQLARDEIASRTPSPLSPMPANVAEIVNEKDFYDLLAFLLSQRPK